MEDRKTTKDGAPDRSEGRRKTAHWKTLGPECPQLLDAIGPDWRWQAAQKTLTSPKTEEILKHYLYRFQQLALAVCITHRLLQDEIQDAAPQIHTHFAAYLRSQNGRF